MAGETVVLKTGGNAVVLKTGGETVVLSEAPAGGNAVTQAVHQDRLRRVD